MDGWSARHWTDRDGGEQGTGQGRRELMQRAGGGAKGHGGLVNYSYRCGVRRRWGTARRVFEDPRRRAGAVWRRDGVEGEGEGDG